MNNEHESGEKIIINGEGKFPKRVVIIENEKAKEYLLVKTKSGKYLLN